MHELPPVGQRGGRGNDGFIKIEEGRDAGLVGIQLGCIHKGQGLLGVAVSGVCGHQCMCCCVRAVGGVSLLGLRGCVGVF